MSFYDDASLIFLAGAAAGKDGKAYSVKPTDGNGDFTFSRGSNLSATRVGPDGLIEKGRENVMRYSNQFTVSGRYSTSASTIELASNEIGYNGNSDVWELAENDATTSHWIRDNQDSITGVGTISVYAKYNGRHLQLRPTGIGSGVAYANFDLISGVKGTSDGPGYIDSTITRVGDTDWYRCSLTINHSGNYSWLAILVDSTSATELPSYPGDGTSGIYMQYAQLEIGLTATEYIESGASTGKAGLLEDEPRFDYSGGATCPSLLLEPSRSQLVKYSEYLGGTDWSAHPTSDPVTHTQNYAIAPDGTQTASLLGNFTSGGFNIVNNSNYRTQTLATQNPLDDTYTMSVWLKTTSGTGTISLLNRGLSSGTNSVQTLQCNVTNEWKRFDLSNTYTAAENASSLGFIIIKTNTDTLEEVLVWGAQMEQASYPTSYIPNHSGGTITRGNDVSHISSMQSNNIVGATDSYTIFFDISNDNVGAGGSGNSQWLKAQDSPSYSNIWTLRKQNVTGQKHHSLYYNKDSTYVFNNETINKGCFVFTTNEIKVFLDGSLNTTYSVTNSPLNLNGFRIDYGSSDRTTIEFSQLLIFPEALSNADCTILTGTSYDTFAAMAEALNYTVYE